MTAFTPTGSLMPKSLPETDTSTKTSLTKEDLAAMFAAELPNSNPPIESAPLEQPNPETGNQPKATRSSFLYRQFPIFSCPKLTVYIQGVLPASALTLADCQPYLKIRLIGAKPATQEADSLLALALINSRELAKGKGFYSNLGRSQHLELVNLLIQAGVAVDPTKALSKANAEASLDAYLTALAEFLTDSGYSDPDVWLADRQPTASANSKITIEQAISLADF